MISTSVPCSSLAMRRHGVRVARELELEVSEKWKLGGFSLLGGGSRQTFEIPLKKPSEERPRGACLGVSEGPRSLRGCAERGCLGAQAFRGSAQVPSEPLVDGLSWHRGTL